MSLLWSRSWICSRCIKHQAGSKPLRRILAPYQARTKRGYATEGSEERLRLAERTRNVGIIAHIDAGKTTTTERMLYYSGYTRRIGDVDDGSTVTDFLPAERARGITIQSAAITFRWPPIEDDRTIHEKYSSTVPHTINLIDTPGHADFTFEVVRSLRILDGAVCILDGVAGVEAQTEKVWQQAENYKIPKIIFVNKLDRDGATFGRTVKEIAVKLFVHPAVCQIPWYEKEAFMGIVDVVELRALKYRAGGDGKQIEVIPLEDLHVLNERLVRETKKARTALVELLSEHDENVVDAFFQADEKHLEVPPEVLWSAMRKCLIQERSPIVPVFAGASFRNIGVQPILDAVNRLLPSPLESPDPEISMGSVNGTLSGLTSGKLSLAPQAQAQVPQTGKRKGPSPKTVAAAINIDNLQACALAFKVVNDSKRGVLIYVRVYHGSLEKNSIIFNTNMGTVERMPRLAIMHANDLVEVDSIPAGHIGVIVGLRSARTGDTMVVYSGMNTKKGLPEPLDKLQLRPIEVPPPVFFTSIVPHSLGEQKNVVAALDLLLREDPSLHVSTDEESGQMLLSGMGELHLEIARDRLINDFKAKASTGDIEIGYRECLNGDPATERITFDRELAGKRARASCTATVAPREVTPEELENTSEIPASERDANVLTIDIVKESTDDVEMPNLPFSHGEISSALQNGVLAALSRGPSFGYSMHNTEVQVSFNPLEDFYGVETSLAAISAAARVAVQAALKKSSKESKSAMMEPVMNVVINVDEPSLGSVVHDLTASRGAQITSLDNEDAPSSTTSSDPNKVVRDEDIRYIDPHKVYAPPDQFDAVIEEEDALPKSMGSKEGSAAVEMRLGRGTRSIVARVPLKEMVGYLKYLRSLTKGRGTFVMSVDKFEKMTRQREKAVLKEIQGV